MNTNQKRTGITGSIPAGIAIGTFFAMITIITLSAIAAKLIDLEWLSYNAIEYAAMFVTVISSFLGTKIAYAKIKRRKLIVSCLLGVALFVSLILAAVLFFEGRIDTLWMNALLILAGTGTAILVPLNTTTRRKGKARRSM